jgi:hypothetical protein
MKETYEKEQKIRVAMEGHIRDIEEAFGTAMDGLTARAVGACHSLEKVTVRGNPTQGFSNIEEILNSSDDRHGDLFLPKEGASQS